MIVIKMYLKNVDIVMIGNLFTICFNSSEKTNRC